jgi:hypothetical protein
VIAVLSLALISLMPTSRGGYSAQDVLLSTDITECEGKLVDRRALVLPDGRSIYVEAQAFVRDGPRVLLAGTPNYIISGTAGSVARDSVFGVILSNDGSLQPVPWPREGRFTDVRATVLPGGGWAVTMAEIEERDPKSPVNPVVLAYWAGRTDGERWWNVQQLPSLQGRLRSINASQLVYHGGDLTLAVPIAGLDVRQEVALYTFHDGQWRASILPTRRAAYVTLTAAGEDTLLLGVVRPDTTERPSDSNSLFLFRRVGQEPWTMLSRLIRGGTEPVTNPFFVRTTSTVGVAWLSESDRGSEAKVLLDLSAAPHDSAFTLSQRAVELLPAYDGEANPLWVAAEAGEGRSAGSINVYAYIGQSPQLVASIPNPFHGWVAAVRESSQLMVVGPVMSNWERFSLGSHVLHFTVRCGPETGY